MSLTSNYLDHLDARLEKQGGRGSLARLLLVARKGEAADDPDAVVRYHERVRTATNQRPIGMFSGSTYSLVIAATALPPAIGRPNNTKSGHGNTELCARDRMIRLLGRFNSLLQHSSTRTLRAPKNEQKRRERSSHGFGVVHVRRVSFPSTSHRPSLPINVLFLCWTCAHGFNLCWLVCNFGCASCTGSIPAASGQHGIVAFWYK